MHVPKERALDKQLEYKKQQKELMKNKKIIAAHKKVYQCPGV